jgi:hypothetical protein
MAMMPIRRAEALRLRLSTLGIMGVLLMTTPAITPHSAWHGEKSGRRVTMGPHGQVRTEATYFRGVLVGEYRTYYDSGAPYELRHFVNGREEGVQQSWTEGGELYLNYEVRDGRRYGLVNAKPCLTVTKKVAP